MAHGELDPSLREELDEFISKNQLDARTTSAVLGTSEDVQRSVLDRGGLEDARNRSAVVLGRIRDAQARLARQPQSQLNGRWSKSPENEPRGRIGRLRREIKSFAERNKLDERVLSIMLNMHPKDVTRVMAHPLPKEVRSSNGFIVHVIRKVEQDSARPSGYKWDGGSWSESPPRRWKRSRSRTRSYSRSPSSSRSSPRCRSESMPRDWVMAKTGGQQSESKSGQIWQPSRIDIEKANQTRSAAAAFFDGSTAFELVVDGSAVIGVPDEFLPNLLNGFPHGFMSLQQADGMKLLEALSGFIDTTKCAKVESSTEIRQSLVIDASGRRLMRKTIMVNGAACATEEQEL
eukprot:TRINITY_DN64512_c0_g1_i1.p1 TRINITY_DN64512_c0_g1~~TRINITY_DN64512_c0_g1_i1.p1  ORF type:complete len:347 (-),score=34.64 TRINITY_DN64512_c0_g1_i1:219-1259(-)